MSERAGLTAAEFRNITGDCKSLLYEWSKPRSNGGKGIPELGGEVLESWHTTRVRSDGRRWPHRVFSRDQAKRLAEARQAQERHRREETGLTDLEAMARHPGLWKRNSMVYWRKTFCLYLGRKMHSWRDREGTIRHRIEDVDQIAERIRQAEGGQWVDPQTHEVFLPLSTIRAQFGIDEYVLYHFGKHRSSYLNGDTFHPREVLWPGKTRVRKGYTKVWPLAQIEQYSRGQQDAHGRNTSKRQLAERFLLDLLRSGPAYGTDIERLAKKSGIGRYRLYQARGNLKIVSRQPGGTGPRVWCLEGQSVDKIQRFKKDGKRSRRGRPKGRIDPDVAKRKKQLLEEWNQGIFGNNKSAAASAHGFQRPNVSKLLPDRPPSV